MKKNRWAGLVVICLFLVSCDWRGDAEIIFVNDSKSAFNVVVEGGAVHWRSGLVEPKNQQVWRGRFKDPVKLNITVTLQSGKILAHEEGYFCNGRRITIYVDDTSLERTVQDEGFL